MITLKLFSECFTQHNVSMRYSIALLLSYVIMSADWLVPSMESCDDWKAKKYEGFACFYELRMFSLGVSKNEEIPALGSLPCSSSMKVWCRLVSKSLIERSLVSSHEKAWIKQQLMVLIAIILWALTPYPSVHGAGKEILYIGMNRSALLWN